MINPHSHFVITHDGRIGLTAGETPSGRIRVQFGSAGPFSAFKPERLRYATEAGLHGVGGKFGEG